jgi:hypothetical protein
MVYTLVRAYSAELGFEIGAHALRATAATNALDHQADDIATTRIYDTARRARRTARRSRSIAERSICNLRSFMLPLFRALLPNQSTDSHFGPVTRASPEWPLVPACSLVEPVCLCVDTIFSRPRPAAQYRPPSHLVGTELESGSIPTVTRRTIPSAAK